MIHPTASPFVYACALQITVVGSGSCNTWGSLFASAEGSFTYADFPVDSTNLCCPTNTGEQ
jgi:hypothetical protein